MNESDYRILIVDDAQKNIQVLGTFLRNEGYQINVARNGRQALEIVGQVQPDLILLDVMMPEMDGFECCQHLKNDPETREIPVIFLTAKVETEDIVKGFEIGSVDYVTKPFHPTELMQRVRTHLELKSSREKLSDLAEKLSKYLSPQVYQSIFSGEKDVRIESYRKTVTVFFSDIVEFTPKAESMSHQELTEWLNNYLNEMSKIALDHGGTVDKFIGDSVMVFFGDPESKGEQQDAIRCSQMAIDMQDRSKQLGISIRIGINTGECTVGNFGSEDRMDYTIIGPQVNAAARLEQQSDPGRILISQSTFELIKDAIPCEQRGAIQVQGIERELMTYWLE